MSQEDKSLILVKHILVKLKQYLKFFNQLGGHHLEHAITKCILLSELGSVSYVEPKTFNLDF